MDIHQIKIENENFQCYFNAPNRVMVCITGDILKTILVENDLINSFAENIVINAMVLPNVLNPTIEQFEEKVGLHIEQIKKGLSTSVWVLEDGFWRPIRYMTVYEYETEVLSGWGEAATALSFDNTYSVESKPQVNYKGAGSLLYKGSTEIAIEKNLALIGTTTGTPSFVASLNNGYIPVPRRAIDAITGEEYSWREVCEPCSNNKTMANLGDSVPNETCVRKPDYLQDYPHIPANEIYKNGGCFVAPCMWRVYVPENHPQYSEIKKMLKLYAIPSDRISEVVSFRNVEGNFI